ncbi:MAG: hypothetical protein ACREGF_01485 [Candidatus Saccharimonadales bacterium]
MLNKPSSGKIYLYNFLTLGFYFFYWCSRSRANINHSARQKLIPSTWLLAVPGGNYWWMWQYAGALDYVSYGRLKSSDTFLLYILATHAFVLLSPLYYFLSGPSHTTASLHTILLIIIIAIIIVFLISIAGAAFFCAVVQHKINALSPS